MAVYFDSHVHFDAFTGEDVSSAAIVERAASVGVGRIIAVGGSDDANQHAMAVAAEFAGRAWPAVGYDRNCAAGDRDMTRLSELIRGKEGGTAPVAIGEIGLDFHYHPETAAEQQELFEDQLCLAREFGLPVIVHSREADAETLAALERHGREGGGVIGVLHCFTGGPEFALKALACGLYISFSGIVTFRNAESIREAARVVPADRLMIETDSPFLAPVPRRGEQNEPMYLPHVAEVIAATRGCPADEIARITTENAMTLFGVSGTA